MIATHTIGIQSGFNIHILKYTYYKNEFCLPTKYLMISKLIICFRNNFVQKEPPLYKTHT